MQTFSAIVGTRKIVALVGYAFLSSNASAEVLQGEISVEWDWFDLETGEIWACTSRRGCFSAPATIDFKFRESNSFPTLWHNTEPESLRKIATFDERPFDQVGFIDIETANFSTEHVDFPLETDDCVILQTDTGKYYKIGNIVYTDNSPIKFDYEELIDENTLHRDGFESLPQ